MSLMGYTFTDVFHMISAVDSGMVMAEEYADTDTYNNLKMTMDFLEGLLEEGRV